MNPKWNESWFSLKRYEAQDGTILAEMSMFNSVWSLRITGTEGFWSNLDPKPLMEYASAPYSRLVAT